MVVGLPRLASTLKRSMVQGWTQLHRVRRFWQPSRVLAESSGPDSWASIATGIDGPRLFQHEGLPVGPPWPDVQRLIASTGGDTPRHIRDRVILMLLATYGFRSGEVAGLCLEDVNWESEILAVSRPSNGAPRST